MEMIPENSKNEQDSLAPSAETKNLQLLFSSETQKMSHIEDIKYTCFADTLPAGHLTLS